MSLDSAGHAETQDVLPGVRRLHAVVAVVVVESVCCSSVSAAVFLVLVDETPGQQYGPGAPCYVPATDECVPASLIQITQMYVQTGNNKILDTPAQHYKIYLGELSILTHIVIAIHVMQQLFL